MDPAGPNLGIQFSTDTLPERDRLPYLREAYGRSIIGLDLEPLQDGPIKLATSLHAFDGLRALSTHTSGIAIRRTRPLLADGNDDSCAHDQSVGRVPAIASRPRMPPRRRV